MSVTGRNGEMVALSLEASTPSDPFGRVLQDNRIMTIVLYSKGMNEVFMVQRELLPGQGRFAASAS